MWRWCTRTFLETLKMDSQPPSVLQSTRVVFLECAHRSRAKHNVAT
jgi:hypothetical protein